MLKKIEVVKSLVVFSFFVIAVGTVKSAYAIPACFQGNDIGNSALCAAFCSPSVKATLVSQVQNTLEQAAASDEFKSATEFNGFVKQTGAMTDPNLKLKAYMQSIGVDTSDSTAVLTFAGARDFSPYIKSAEQNLHLKPEQSEILVNQFSGSINNFIKQQ
jgi:hypothetical protein